jgi:uncharacterized membrane protein
MSLKRRRVVVLASSVAAMSGLGTLLFHRHAWLGWAWVGLEVALLVWVVVLMMRLRRDEGSA